MNREQWLEERKTGIGGSDVAAILSLSKWRTPRSQPSSPATTRWPRAAALACFWTRAVGVRSSRRRRRTASTARTATRGLGMECRYDVEYVRDRRVVAARCEVRRGERKPGSL